MAWGHRSLDATPRACPARSPGGSRLAALAALAALLAGCTAQGGVSNQPDAFSHGGPWLNKNGAEGYAWQNGGTAATVNRGGQGTGSFTITLKDAAGTQVYQRSFNGSGQGGATETSSRGVPGQWQVLPSFSGFNGQGELSITRS